MRRSNSEVKHNEMEKTSGEMKYADVIHITTSPPAERSKQDIERVTDWIRKRSPMFAGNS